MVSPEERQPGLRMAGLENLVDTPQKRIRATVLTGLTGVLAMEAFSVAAQDEDEDEEPTATATATGNGNSGTATPEARTTEVAQGATATPIPRTEVAALPANASSLEFMMSGYPNRAEFTSNWNERINVELDFTDNQLMGNDGRALVPGIHYLRPENLDPTVLNREYNINGADVEQLLLVGFITFEPSPEVGIVVYLNVPMQVVNPDGTIDTSSTEPQYGRFFWAPLSLTNIRALREDGSVIPAPASFEDGPIPGGRDPNSNVFFDKFSQTISFPTAEGVVTVRDGQEVGISIIRNVEDVALDISQQNGNRTVDQIIEDMMNTDPNDDGVAFIYPVGVIVAR